jgi:hypothetical protein
MRIRKIKVIEIQKKVNYLITLSETKKRQLDMQREKSRDKFLYSYKDTPRNSMHSRTMKICYGRIDFVFSYLFFLYLQLLSFLLKEEDYDPIMDSSKYLPVYGFKMVLLRCE